MKSTKLLMVLVAIMGLTFIATANADYRTLRQDRPVIVYEDHPWGGEVTGGGAASINKVIIPELIGTQFGVINNLRIIIIYINDIDSDDNNDLLPDDFGDTGDNHHNGAKGN